MNTLNYPHNQEYTTTLSYQTQIIKKADGEQRIAKNLHPTRSFNLKYELSPTNAQKFIEDYKTIRKNPFFYSWCGFAPYLGQNDPTQDTPKPACDGQNQDFLLRIDQSQISLKALQFGYMQVSLGAFCIDDGSIFKCRYLRPSKALEAIGVQFENGANYQGEGKISQKILETGKLYKAKIHSVQRIGPSPTISAQTAGQAQYITTGEAEIRFIAASSDFCIEFEEGACGNISEVAIYPLSNPDIPRENGLFVMDFQPNEKHTVELQSFCEGDEILTPQYAVREYNSATKRRLELEFEFSPAESARFERFFRAQMGRYRAFFYDYAGERLKVRFDADKAEFKVFPLGYSKVKIPIIEV